MAGGDELIMPGWLTTDEAAQLVDYTVGYVRQLASEGKVEARKLGRDWLINQESLLAYKAQARPGRPRDRDKGTRDAVGPTEKDRQAIARIVDEKKRRKQG